MWKVKGRIDGNALLMTGPGMERIEVDRRDEVTVDDLVVVHPITQLLTVDSQCECGRVGWSCRQCWRSGPQDALAALRCDPSTCSGASSLD